MQRLAAEDIEFALPSRTLYVRPPGESAIAAAGAPG
jgi:hypothetical protein